MMTELKAYFTVGSEKWKATVKWCVRLGFATGLIAGAAILLR